MLRGDKVGIYSAHEIKILSLLKAPLWKTKMLRALSDKLLNGRKQKQRCDKKTSIQNIQIILKRKIKKVVKLAKMYKETSYQRR